MNVFTEVHRFDGYCSDMLSAIRCLDMLWPSTTHPGTAMAALSSESKNVQIWCWWGCAFSESPRGECLVSSWSLVLPAVLGTTEPTDTSLQTLPLWSSCTLLLCLNSYLLTQTQGTGFRAAHPNPAGSHLDCVCKHLVFK